MLGRRNVRIKVMQTLYTWEIDREIEVGKLEKQLESRMEKSTWLYLTDLLYVIEVCRYSMVHKAKGMAKYIKTEEDEKASTIIAGNCIVQYLDGNEQFNALVKSTGVRNYVNPDIVKALFTDLSAKPKYKEYAALPAPSLEKDKEIIQLLLKKVIPASKDLENHLEELFTNYHDDNSLLLHVIGKYVDAFEPEGKNAFFQGLELWDDGKKIRHRTAGQNHRPQRRTHQTHSAQTKKLGNGPRGHTGPHPPQTRCVRTALLPHHTRKSYHQRVYRSIQTIQHPQKQGFCKRRAR